MRRTIIVICLLFLGTSLLVLGQQDQQTSPIRWWVGFSPEGTGEPLVIRALQSAQQEIRVAVYSLTRTSIVKELTEAKSKGVDVQVKVDRLQAGNETMAQAIQILQDRQIPVMVIDPAGDGAMHHKFAVIDQELVVCGSFNWTTNAAVNNYEDVLVIQHKPLAQYYLNQWQQIVSGKPTPPQEAQPQQQSPPTANETIVYVTRTGKKYHRAGCRYLSKSMIPMKLEEAIAAGYSACSVCGGG
jgi:phosphatidylserine/phosphatidylglycerophosphate/cardiolipin synthase-like enzyme